MFSYCPSHIRFDFTGGEIASAICAAAELAAKQPPGTATITNDNLFTVSELEQKRKELSSPHILSIFQ